MLPALNITLLLKLVINSELLFADITFYEYNRNSEFITEVIKYLK